MRPSGFGDPGLDAVQASVALLGIIITGIHDHHRIGYALKKILAELWDFPFRNGDNHDLSGVRSVLDGDRLRSCFASQVFNPSAPRELAMLT